MPTKDNGTSNGSQQRSTAPLISGEQRTAQLALAQECMEHEWSHNPRWKGVQRPYRAEDVLRLRGSIVSVRPSTRLTAVREG
jgi:hypothetical protein